MVAFDIDDLGFDRVVSGGGEAAGWAPPRWCRPGCTGAPPRCGRAGCPVCNMKQCVVRSHGLVILRCEGSAVPVGPLPGQLVYLVRDDRLVRLEVVDDLGPALGAVPDLGGPRAPANTSYQ